MASTAAKIAKYVKLFKDFLPKGRLWSPEDQPVFKKLISSVVQESCRVDDRVRKMLDVEIDPRTADETLLEWERFLGIPDECTPEGQSTNERRQQATQKFTNVGGLTADYYEENNLRLGFDTTVENRVNFTVGRGRVGDLLSNYFNTHFVVGSTVGEQLQVVGWRFFFNVEMPIVAATHFVAGSVVGTPLLIAENSLIQCTMRKLKPAHTGVTFTFK